MATYCFRCDGGHDPDCPVTVVLNTNDPSAMNKGFPHHFVRDYRAERVGVGSGVRVSRTGTVRDQAELLLPTNRDFRGPGDPDGTKGMRAWHDRFQPADDNPRPAKVGDIEKRVF